MVLRERRYRSMNFQQARDQISMFYGPPMSMMSDCIRGMLIAEEGHELVACDFSAIEARGLAWLAGEERILEIFRGEGKIYEYFAGIIYGVSPNEISKDDPRRQVGKVALLALGYGGGVGAFQTMASGYGVKVTDKEAEKIKKMWRDGNPNIVNFWYELENAAMDAIANPGVIFSAGFAGRQIKYKMNGSFLFCRLPSGRVLSYPYARLDDFVWCRDNLGTKKRVLYTTAIAQNYKMDGSPTKGMTYMSENSVTRKWTREPTYGGSLSENCTQAVCCDLLAEAIVRLEERHFPVVLHAHDEAVAEVKIGIYGDNVVYEMSKIMTENPVWAKDFPLSASGWHGKRYRK